MLWHAPAWHNGDIQGASTAARKNVATLARHVAAGRTVVATNPTCSQMIRIEYPRLLGTEDAKTVAVKTTDPTTFLASLATQGKFNRDFKTGACAIAYPMPCQLRIQNIGYKTRDILALLPDTTVTTVEACSGHDGTWAVKKEHFEDSLKWGGRAFKELKVAEPDITCSDCPLAAIQIEQGTGRRPLNPIEILAKKLSRREDQRVTKMRRGYDARMKQKHSFSPFHLNHLLILTYHRSTTVAPTVAY